jgi:two-component system, NarL family, response regulator LiaR
MPSIRLLVAEDSTLVRQLLVHHLAREPHLEVVGGARNGREAVELALKLRPDVVVMDLDMPLLNGVQATERIMGQMPQVRVILLTAHEDLASVGRLSGAFACMNKSATPQEVVGEIRRAHESKRQRVHQEVPVNDHGVAIEVISTRYGLTDLERTVLERVIGAELTIEQIAGELASRTRQKVTVSSVKHTLGRVMTKLRIEPRTRAALVKHVLELSKSV